MIFSEFHIRQAYVGALVTVSAEASVLQLFIIRPSRSLFFGGGDDVKSCEYAKMCGIYEICKLFGKL